MRANHIWAMVLATLIAWPLLSGNCLAQTRDQKVLNDRNNLLGDDTWYYDDLDSALEAAAQSKKPLMVVLRCIP